MKRIALALAVWLLLAVSAYSQIIGGGILGGSHTGSPNFPDQLDPVAWWDANYGVYTDAAVQFTAPDKSWLQIADASQTGLDPGTDDFLVSKWVWCDTLTSYHIIVDKRGTGNTGGYAIYLDSTGAITAICAQGSSGHIGIAATTGKVSAGVWTHIAAYFDRSANVTVYINGVADATTGVISTQPGSVDSANAFSIGADSRSGYNSGLNGRIDSLMFFKATDLSAVASDIIAWAYNSGAGRLCSELDPASATGVAWGAISGYELSESSGTRYDSWGTNHLQQAFSNIIQGPTYGSELLVNGGFETAGAGGADIWSDWTESASDGALANETTDKYAGDDAAKVTAGATKDTMVAYDNVVVAASSTYRLEFWCHGDGTNAPRYYVYDESNTDYILATTSTGVTGTNYTKVVYDIVTPAGCTSIDIGLVCPDAAGGIAYFDSVSVKLVSTALNNGGFENWTVPSAAELVTNGNFTGGITGWTNNATYPWDTCEAAADALHIAANGDGVPATCNVSSTAFSLTSGAVYRIRATLTRTSGAIGVMVAESEAGTSLGYSTAFANTASVDTYFRATGTDASAYLRFYAGNDTASDWLIDSVSIQQVPSNADTWTEYQYGSSLIYREDAAPYHGSHALAMQIDASNTEALVSIGLPTNGKLYSYTVYAKAASGTPTIIVGDTSGGYNTHTLSTSYAAYTGAFRQSTISLIDRGSATSNTITIDSVTLAAAEIQAGAGIVRGAAINGGDVSYWTDRSGTGNHAYMVTLAQRPLLVTSQINGLPILDFDGVDDRLTTPLAGLAAATIFLVGKTTTAGDVMFGVDESNDRSYISAVAGPVIGGGVATHSDTTIVSNESPASAYRIICLTYGGNGTVEALYVDGVEEYAGTQSGVIGTAKTYAVGALNNNDTLQNFAECEIAAILVYDSVLSTNERNAITASLQNTYSLAP